MNNTQYLLAPHSVNGLGPKRLELLLNYFHDPKLAWEASGEILIEIGIPKKVTELLEVRRKDLNPEEYFEKIYKNCIKWITIYDDNYPTPLKQIYDPPTVLYYKGELALSDDQAIAIVGTRKVTGYGRTITEQFARDLSNGGFTIVSGLARGVDSIAHWAVVNAKGRTWVD